MAKNRSRKQKLAARGRTGLISGLAGFVALQLGLALAMERWLPEFRDPEYGNRLTRLYRRTAAVEAPPLTVVMLGSSRTTTGFQATRLEAYLNRNLKRPVVVFNFGITGAGPLMQLLDLRRLLDQGIRPDLLLIELFPPLLSDHEPDAELKRVPVTRVWLRELSLLTTHGGSAKELHAAWWQAWPFPWYTHRFAILSRFMPGFVPYRVRMDWVYQIDQCGWFNRAGGKATPEARRRLVARTRQEYLGWLSQFRLGGLPCRALREIVALCREERISAGLVVMPEGSDFRSCYPAVAWREIERFRDDLRRQYSLNVANAREWMTDEAFVDGHHLSPKGAAEFTERLGREAVLPWILQTNTVTACVDSGIPERGRESPILLRASLRQDRAHLLQP
jgi:hypothetical protein